MNVSNSIHHFNDVLEHHICWTLLVCIPTAVSTWQNGKVHQSLTGSWQTHAQNAAATRTISISMRPMSIARQIVLFYVDFIWITIIVPVITNTDTDVGTGIGTATSTYITKTIIPSFEREFMNVLLLFTLHLMQHTLTHVGIPFESNLVEFYMQQPSQYMQWN